MRELAELAHVYEPIDLRSIAELVPASPTPTLPYPKQTYQIKIHHMPLLSFSLYLRVQTIAPGRWTPCPSKVCVAATQHRHGLLAPSKIWKFPCI